MREEVEKNNEALEMLRDESVASRMSWVEGRREKGKDDKKEWISLDIVNKLLGLSQGAMDAVAG